MASLIGALGALGNTVGIGDASNPNALQRMNQNASPEGLQQAALRSLATDPTFNSADPVQQQARILAATGDIGTAQNLAMYSQMFARPQTQTAAQSPNGVAGAPLLPWQPNQNPVNTSSFGNTANLDQNAQMMLSNAMRIIDPNERAKALSNAWKSIYENNPVIKGQQTAQEKQNTPLIDNQGRAYYPPAPPALASFSAPAKSSPTPTSSAPISAPNAAKVNDVFGSGSGYPVTPETNVMPNPIPGTTPGVTSKQPLAQDGKPLVPNIGNASLYPPNPTRLPDFQPDLPANPSKTDVDNATNVAKNQTDLATKQYEGFGTLQNALSNEKYYAERMAAIYQDMSSPSAASEWPEIAKKAYNLGLISDPSAVKNLGDIQEAINTGAKAVLSTLKDQSAGLDPNHPMRIFGTEVSASLETAINPSITPQARYNSILTTLGLANRTLDGINSYNSAAVGGLGNRLNGGKTMSPSDYMQQFISEHDANDYRKIAQDNTAPFKGMPNASTQSQETPWVTTPKGTKYRVLP